MVARINTGKNISKSLNYNEQKVSKGTAEILAASGFIKEAIDMNFYEKLARFQSLITLNERTVTNALHVSLNFDPSETIPNEKMIVIADVYMQKIGFGQQPYLVYRHYDSGHPHIHIVSTNIERDGKRIPMHNLGRNQSEKARREIEVTFDLVKADSKKLSDAFKLVPVNAQKVAYGRTATKQAISNVLLQVIDKYKYSSLPELNAVLTLYNVIAEPCGKGPATHRQKGLANQGLFYRVLNDNGRSIGVPIKASAFFMKPTLANLTRKFAMNEQLKAPFAKRITTVINWAMRTSLKDIKALAELLEKDNISLIVRENKEGIIYGLTYIDHKTKTVFNGSDLGKSYSATAIQEMLTPSNTVRLELNTALVQSGTRTQLTEDVPYPRHQSKAEEQFNDTNGRRIIENNIDANVGSNKPALMPDSKFLSADNSAPFEPPKKRKKKRKRINL